MSNDLDRPRLARNGTRPSLHVFESGTAVWYTRIMWRVERGRL